MRKFLSLSLISVVVIASTALGDTIHLKNGSVLKGKVASFADDQFIVMLDTGSGRYVSRAMVYMGDVARIEFDAGAGATGDSSASGSQAVETPTRTVSDPPRTTTAEPIRNSPPAEQPKREP